MTGAEGAAVGGAAAAAAAAKRKRDHEEEEEVTPLHPDPAAPFEYKIIRSATGAFKHPAKFRAFLEEEARAGWELLEKLDDSRARLKRPVSCRQQDGESNQDPYRIKVGVGEGTIVVWVLVGVVAAIAAMLGTLALVLNR